MNEDIASAKDGGNGYSRSKSLGTLAVEALKEAGLTKELGKTVHVNVTINKSPATMTTANVTAVGTNAIAYSLSDAERGLTHIQRRKPFILDLANTTPTSKMYVQWSEQENPDGTAGETAQGSDKNQIDFDWVEKSKKVEKLTAFIKVSKEALDDLDGLR